MMQEPLRTHRKVNKIIVRKKVAVKRPKKVAVKRPRSIEKKAEKRSEKKPLRTGARGILPGTEADIKKCTSCGKYITIPGDERPLVIRCDSCEKEFILKGRSSWEFRRCRCSNVIGIPADWGRDSITCNNCGHTYDLGEKRTTIRTVKRTAGKNEVGIQVIRSPSREPGNTSMPELPELEPTVEPSVETEMPVEPEPTTETMEPAGISVSKSCPVCGSHMALGCNACGNCGHMLKPVVLLSGNEPSPQSILHLTPELAVGHA